MRCICFERAWWLCLLQQIRKLGWTTENPTWTETNNWNNNNNNNWNSAVIKTRRCIDFGGSDMTQYNEEAQRRSTWWVARHGSESRDTNWGTQKPWNLYLWRSREHACSDPVSPWPWWPWHERNSSCRSSLPCRGTYGSYPCSDRLSCHPAFLSLSAWKQFQIEWSKLDAILTLNETFEPRLSTPHAIRPVKWTGSIEIGTSLEETDLSWVIQWASRSKRLSFRAQLTHSTDIVSLGLTPRARTDDIIASQNASHGERPSCLAVTPTGKYKTCDQTAESITGIQIQSTEGWKERERGETEWLRERGETDWLRERGEMDWLRERGEMD